MEWWGVGELWGGGVVDGVGGDFAEEYLNPPLRAATLRQEPRLAFADDFFSLIYCNIRGSPNLTDHANGWLLELHRRWQRRSA